jgi:type II secretory pathway pseudopilin PulG
MTRHDPHGEDGSILVIAILMMAVMLAVGLASFSFADSGQKRAHEQRQRETTLNITEGALYSQGFALAQTWPGNAAGAAAIPSACTSQTVQALCPDPNTLAAGNSSAPSSANFTNVDASANVSWSTHIRDNGGPLSDAFVYSQLDAAQSGTNVKTGTSYTCPSPCKWDANGDLKLWVQARAVVAGQSRNVVALLKREQFSEPFPRNGVTAGSMETTNQGNKTIVDSTGSQVVVRCASTAATCTDYNAAKNQVLPATIVRDPATPAAMTAAQIARFMAVAKSASPSTYYTSCPASYTGTVVFVDLPSSATSCSDSNSATYNSSISPGIVIMPRGTFSMKGSLHGIVYMGNEQNSTGPVLTMQANSEVFGGVAIDGPGRLVVGQASGQRATITFVANAFNSLATYGTTGLVQNTWRELPPS